MRLVASLCLLAAACGPVLLFGDEAADGGQQPPVEQMDAGTAGVRAGTGGASSASPSEPALPRALIAIKAVDCGRCFELLASGVDGVPPYRFQWDDGSLGAQRRVCPNQKQVEVSVVVWDATSVRSAPNATRLDTSASASCPPPPDPPAKLCIMNPSFEGTAAVNLGNPPLFDAPPWKACPNTASSPNTPDIGSELLAVTDGVPKPVDGLTYVSLGEAEHVSQQLCQPVQGGSPRYLQLDVARISVTGGVVPETEVLFLEILGGISADCSQRQLLWTSTPLDFGWKRFCAKLKPVDFMDQITLRATSDNSAIGPSYMLIDNLVPVDACP